MNTVPQVAKAMDTVLNTTSDAVGRQAGFVGRRHDRTSPRQGAPLPPGALRLADLGYFSLDVLRDMARQKAFFLSR